MNSLSCSIPIPSTMAQFFFSFLLGMSITRYSRCKQISNSGPTYIENANLIPEQVGTDSVIPPPLSSGSNVTDDALYVVNNTVDDTDNQTIWFQNLPSLVTGKDLNVTICYRCMSECNLQLLTYVIGKDNEKLCSVSNSRISAQTNTNRQPDHLVGNLTYRIVLPTAHVFYDPRKKLLPTNYFSSHLKLKVILRNGRGEIASKTPMVTVDKYIPLTSPVRRQNLPGFCYPWLVSLEERMSLKKILKCSNNQEFVELVSGIVASSGSESGFMRKVPDPVLPEGIPEHIVKDLTRITRFTLSTWVFLDSYCQKDFCSLLSHRNSSDYFTPAIFLNKKGSLHIQLHRRNGLGEAFLTAQVPLKKWIYLVLSVNENQASLLFADDIVTMTHLLYVHTLQERVYCNVTSGLWNSGGYNSFTGIVGFIGPTRLYRYRHIVPHYVPRSEADRAVVLGSGIHKLIAKCRTLLSAVNIFWTYNTFRAPTGKCARKKWRYFFLKEAEISKEDRESELPKSFTRTVQKRAHYLLSLVNGTFVSYPNLTIIGRKLYEVSKKQLFLKKNDTVLADLETAGCFGISKAFFEAGAMLTSGFFNTVNPQKALLYHLYGAMQGNGLAQLALGYKHQLGASGAVMNCLKAAGYIKAAGLLTKHLIENEKSKVHTHSELIRLDEATKVANFRGEKSDVVNWLAQQAERGSKEAQGKIAEILFHGHHGVNINRDRAIDFYRLGANQGDPMALYNLGVLYLRGIEVEKNETKGKELFHRSAKQNFSMAFNSLGYVEMVLHKNRTAAAQYFLKGIEFNDRESMFHYGSLLEGGIGKALPNKAAAMKYYKKSAARGQKAACLKVGDAVILDEVPGTCPDAVKYFRYVAEQLSDIGMLLRQGLDSYLAGDWKNSMLGYLFAAEAGLSLGAYNLARLCEEHEDTQSFFNGRCQHYFYNLSAELGYPASLIAMGDRSWLGKGMKKDVQKSAIYYARALEAGDSPQALYSLAYLVENNYNLSGIHFNALQKDGVASGNRTLAMDLYERCMKISHREYEGFYPCYLASLFLKVRTTVREPYFKAAAVLFLPMLVSASALVLMADDTL